MPKRNPYDAAAQIIFDAGGELVGRTRLQKIAYLLQVAGYSDDFSFEYKHYGPYSEELSQAMEISVLLGPVEEQEKIADWGGRYSIYTIRQGNFDIDEDRSNFVKMAKAFDAVELELAATSVYLFAVEGIGKTVSGNPWAETARRKPSKAAGGRLERAALTYETLRHAKTRLPLPQLPAP